MHMLHAAAEEIDPLAVQIHTDACLGTRFQSKDISQGGGLHQALVQRHGPSLLVWGEHDVTADPEVIGSALAASVPDGRAHVVKGAGHWVQFERADEVNALLLNECQASL
jgi:pimeloyl-ACP methyl ester carboxylesterase